MPPYGIAMCCMWVGMGTPPPPPGTATRPRCDGYGWFTAAAAMVVAVGWLPDVAATADTDAPAPAPPPPPLIAVVRAAPLTAGANELGVDDGPSAGGGGGGASSWQRTRPGGAPLPHAMHTVPWGSFSSVHMGQAHGRKAASLSACSLLRHAFRVGRCSGSCDSSSHTMVCTPGGHIQPTEATTHGTQGVS